MSRPVFPLDPDELAGGIGIPLDRWPGNCHGIAEAILRRMPTEGMRLVRGHYDGPVARGSIFSGQGLHQHSWLRLGDGRILDPTRWTMTAPERPFIYLGENDHYDEAGLAAAQRVRPQMFMSLMLSGAAVAPARAIAAGLAQRRPEVRAELAEAAGIPGLASRDIPVAVAEELRGLLGDPVEHHADPERLYAAAAGAGLKALIRIDLWVHVMEPERVTPSRGANLVYADPPRDELTEMQKLFCIFARFLSIEDRGDTIERELAEYGYRLDDLHHALNEMEGWLRFDPDLPHMPAQQRDLLCVVAADLLGKGFGEELRVERYADSLGLDRGALHRALVRFAEPAGFDLGWLSGREAEVAAQLRCLDPEQDGMSM